MQKTNNEKRYLTFRRYLKNKYNCSVRKLSIHTGLTCPNRDGTLGVGGCIFCNNQSFHPDSGSDVPIRTQIAQQIEKYKINGRAEKFIAYFQTFTNTYAPIKELKQIYDVIYEFPDIVALSIGTRPDCVTPEILDLIETYSAQYEVWIEYGLQSANNETLQKINRGHTFEQFLQAIGLTELRSIKSCVHVILGLPGETHNDVMYTANSLAKLSIDGIKFHPLQILRETKLKSLYNSGKIQVLEKDTYISWLVDFIELLPQHIVIQRLTADAQGDLLVAPEWCRDKMHVLQDIDSEFERRNSYQGARYRNFETPDI